MLLIPVLDILDGLIVHAIQGERQNYKPVNSVLTNETSLDTVLSAYYKLYPFNTVYLADLNAIQGQGNGLEQIQKIVMQYPDCEFWLDAGVELSQKILAESINNNIKIVIGSESSISKKDYLKLIENYPNIILSLDFNSKGLIANQYLLEDPELWPKQVIIMMLNKVGSNSGIDIVFLNNIIKMNKHSSLYVAGGIRNSEDIRQLDTLGIDGCLIASALHNGAITNKDLQLLKN